MDIIQQLESLHDLGAAVAHVESVLDKHNEECKAEDIDHCAFHTSCLAVAIVMQRLGLELEDIGTVAAQLVMLDVVVDAAFDEEEEDSDILEAKEIG